MTIQFIDEQYAEAGKIKSFELATLIRQQIDVIYSMIPIGAIYPIMTNIPGVPAPDSNIWQLCDGSEITNQYSPMRSVAGAPRYTPNMTDRFVRITKALGSVGSSGGTSVYGGFGHTHTVGENDMPNVEGADFNFNSLRMTRNDNHTHTMERALDGDYGLEPPFITLKYFMKIQ